MFSGNTSSAAGDAVYIEDVFSTYLYTGNNTARSIVNNIDLSTKGGMVWLKDRTTAYSNYLLDTNRGATNYLVSDVTDAQNTNANNLTAFNTNGFSLGVANTINATNDNFVSWTFRKQPKFFDVVTYTGNGASRNIAHSLGSTPGCVIIKRTDSADNWQVWHRSLPSNPGAGLYLNTTDAELATYRIYPDPSSTVFSVSSGASVNASGGTYVAYLFAHDAGGFGLTGTDNVISCGSFTTDGSGNASVTLGYEPQYILYKRTNAASTWYVADNMRGLGVFGSNLLKPNAADAEITGATDPKINATGFSVNNNSVGVSSTYIYIAIRKGPMKVPTDATTVFSPTTFTGNGSASNLTTGFATDFVINVNTSKTWDSRNFTLSRLTGDYNILSTNFTTAEAYNSASLSFTKSNANTGVSFNGNLLNGNGYPYVQYGFKRAPKFFDQVCFTATASTNQRVTHNLGVAPDLIIVKARSAANWWIGYISTSALSTAGRSKWFIFSGSNTMQSATDAWGTSDPTVTDFGINQSFFSTGAGETDVAYLFATLEGVSKVGSYTGTGTLTTINCGFTGGARFVMIKRTDATGDWFIWDTARGMVSGTDPSYALNNSNAQINANSVYTATTGFQLLASPSANVNTNGGTYIYLAIA